MSSRIISYLLATWVIILIFLFIPITQEFYATPKLFISGMISILLLITYAATSIRTARVHYLPKITLPLLLFIMTQLASLILVSPNHFQALVTTQTGLLTILCAGILSIFMTWTPKSFLTRMLVLVVGSGVLISIISFISLTGLMHTEFSPLGSLVDQFFFLLASFLFSLFFLKNSPDKKMPALFASMLIFLGLCITSFFLFQPAPNGSVWERSHAPLVNTVKSVGYIFHSPFSALLGVGIDNFELAFNQTKDASFNSLPIWNASFTTGSSQLFTTVTESGFLGFLGISFLILFAGLTVFNKNNLIKNREIKVLLFCLSCFLLLFSPPTFITRSLFLLFLAASTLGNDAEDHPAIELSPVLRVMVPLFLIAIAGISSFFLFRWYGAEYTFKQGLDAFSKNDIGQAYNLEKQAVVQTPQNERMRANFAQVNLLLADSIAGKKNLTSDQKHTAAQAIQVAIEESKAVVSLNPQRAQNWEQLGTLYHTLFALVPDSQSWAIASFERAISLDPNNPTYYVELANSYYDMSSFKDARTNYLQAIKLKPDLGQKFAKFLK